MLFLLYQLSILHHTVLSAPVEAFDVSDDGWKRSKDVEISNRWLFRSGFVLLSSCIYLLEVDYAAAVQHDVCPLKCSVSD